MSTTNMKMRFFCPKHKATGTYKGTFIAENEEIARNLAVKNGVLKAEELDSYVFEDITQEMTKRDKMINKVYT